MDKVIQLNLNDFDAVIFDMDGTMIDNMAHHKKAWMGFAKRHGLHLTEEEFKEKISGNKNDKILQLLFNKGLTPEEIEEYSEEKEAVYRELYAQEIREVPGLVNMIKLLESHHKKLAIATTAPEKNREFGLKALNLKDVFHIILGDEHVQNGKPHPEIYLETAKLLGVKLDRCLVFEDTPRGVQAGKNAGMTVVAVLTGHSEDALKEADYRVKDFTAIKFH